MNKEVMAVYSREGINPMGGCFQMFLQMPVWFGLNTALRYAIEMRHATWLWITDLSSKDPYYVLPVLMGASMYLVSKMTPMTATDPQQQAMMKIMPITMAGIFMISPISRRLGGVYSHQQRGRYRPAVVPEPHASAARTCKDRAWEEVLRKNFREADAARNVRTTQWLKNSSAMGSWTAKRRPRPCDIFWRPWCVFPRSS